MKKRKKRGMLVSDDRGFVFIHVQKAAGTSITTAPRLHAYAMYRSKLYSFLRAFGLSHDYRRYKFRIHASLRDVQHKIPASLFGSYFKFTFVRNPCDRLVYDPLPQQSRSGRLA